MHFSQIQHNLTCSDNLCKLGKEYLKHSHASVILFLERILTFDYYKPFSHYLSQSHQLSKTVRCFWPTLYVYTV